MGGSTMNKYFLLVLAVLFLTHAGSYSLANKRFLKPNQTSQGDTLLLKKLRESAYKKWQVENVAINRDTLKITSFSDFLYYPFGKYPNIETFSGHNKFWGKPKLKTYLKPDKTTIYIFNHLQSSLQVLKNSDTKSIDIVNSKISDPDIVLVNPIVIGMSETAFMKIFFSNINQDGLENIKVVKFESGILGIWNKYFFANGRLNRITFDSDYILN
jgi:hypothetical protein